MATRIAHDHEWLVRRAFEAYARGDVTLVREVLAPDAVWHVAGHGPVGGDYRGRDAIVGDYFVRLMRLSGGTFRVETHDVLASADHVVALITATYRSGTRQRSSRQAVVCHVDGNLVSEVWSFAFDPVEEFWAPPDVLWA